MNKNKLTKLKLALQKLLVEYTALTTDKGILYFEEDDIKTDIQVYLEDETGEKQVAEPGTYETETQIITVANGRITEIIEKTTEENMTDEKTKKKEAFEAQKMNFEATYQEVQRNIYNEFEKNHIYCYIVENTNTYAVVSIWDEDELTDKLFKYNITVDEDGKVTLGEGYEVKIEYVAKMEEQTPAPTPVEDTVEPTPTPIEEPTSTPDPAPIEEPADPQPTEKEAELNKEIEELKAKIAELEAKYYKKKLFPEGVCKFADIFEDYIELAKSDEYQTYLENCRNAWKSGLHGEDFKEFVTQEKMTLYNMDIRFKTMLEDKI